MGYVVSEHLRHEIIPLNPSFESISKQFSSESDRSKQIVYCPFLIRVGMLFGLHLTQVNSLLYSMHPIMFPNLHSLLLFKKYKSTHFEHSPSDSVFVYLKPIY